ncbi:helix-turn-helix domain-containing protein [Chromobacterium haemolyticum]|uniref:helix-turn-helix domain-containing protein n=1 Tax=Chromobacterium haemolyticum TaxID=394935 RepID=UPI000DEEC8CE|nr:helix-turn-helix domain-containing protein [Chromobacterium haemolyticum]
MEENAKLAISRRIREVRKYRGQTQPWVAERMGIAQASVSDWERGKTSPTVANISLFCSLFDVNFEYVATGRGPMEGPNHAPPPGFELKELEPLQYSTPIEADEQELLQIYRSLTKARRRAMLQFIRDWSGKK